MYNNTKINVFWFCYLAFVSTIWFLVIILSYNKYLFILSIIFGLLLYIYKIKTINKVIIFKDLNLKTLFVNILLYFFIFICYSFIFFVIWKILNLLNIYDVIFINDEIFFNFQRRIVIGFSAFSYFIAVPIFLHKYEFPDNIDIREIVFILISLIFISINIYYTIMFTSIIIFTLLPDFLKIKLYKIKDSIFKNKDAKIKSFSALLVLALLPIGGGINILGIETTSLYLFNSNLIQIIPVLDNPANKSTSASSSIVHNNNNYLETYAKAVAKNKDSDEAMQQIILSGTGVTFVVGSGAAYYHYQNSSTGQADKKASNFYHNIHGSRNQVLLRVENMQSWFDKGVLPHEHPDKPHFLYRGLGEQIKFMNWINDYHQKTININNDADKSFKSFKRILNESPIFGDSSIMGNLNTPFEIRAKMFIFGRCHMLPGSRVVFGGCAAGATALSMMELFRAHHHQVAINKDFQKIIQKGDKIESNNESSRSLTSSSSSTSSSS